MPKSGRRTNTSIYMVYMSIFHMTETCPVVLYILVLAILKYILLSYLVLKGHLVFDTYYIILFNWITERRPGRISLIN